MLVYKNKKADKHHVAKDEFLCTSDRFQRVLGGPKENFFFLGGGGLNLYQAKSGAILILGGWVGGPKKNILVRIYIMVLKWPQATNQLY